MAKCHQNRFTHRKRARANEQYPIRMQRKLSRQLREMPTGVTIASRSYGFAVYADTPQARNIPGHAGEASVRCDTRIGGYSVEEFDVAAMHAHERLNTRTWQLWQRFKPAPRCRQRRSR